MTRRLCSAVCIPLFAAAIGTQAQFPGMQAPKHYPWSDGSLSPDARADMVVKQMTLDEKIGMVHGPGWQVLLTPPEPGTSTKFANYIPGIPRLGIPALEMTDSVEGVSGVGNTGRYATPLPSAEAMAAAWDPALSYKIGTTLGHEMRALGFNMSLGSGINMIREPRDGRTFEYKGEDPLDCGDWRSRRCRRDVGRRLFAGVAAGWQSRSADTRTGKESLGILSGTGISALHSAQRDSRDCAARDGEVRSRNRCRIGSRARQVRAGCDCLRRAA